MNNQNKDCMITLTIFSEDTDLITYMACQYMYDMCNMLGYRVNNVTTGKHIEANKPHWHIMYNINIQEGKYYKTLNQTLIRRATELLFPSKKIADDFRDTEMKISFIYDGESKSHKKRQIVYGKSYMRYVFKEYNSIDKVDMKLQYGFSIEEIEVLRKQAHAEWIILKDKQQRAIEQEISDKDDHIEMKSYLQHRLHMYANSLRTDQLIHRTMVELWNYKKMKHSQGKVKTIRVGSVQDQAISWLVFNNYITTDEIVSMTIKI